MFAGGIIIKKRGKLIEDAFTVQCTNTDADEADTPLLVGKNIKMFFDSIDGATAYYGHVISTVFTIDNIFSDL